MRISVFRFVLIIFIFFCSFFSISYFVQAAPQKKPQNKLEITKKDIAFTLMQKAKKAMISGNPKQAESYWQQANSIDSTQTKPMWIKKDIHSLYPNNRSEIVIEESKFIEQLKNMPYELAKIELDKKLLANPNNTKLRLVYLELSEKNGDEIEANRHRSLLGMKPIQQPNNGVWVKYILVLIILGLIIYEIINIVKIHKKTN